MIQAVLDAARQSVIRVADQDIGDLRDSNFLHFDNLARRLLVGLPDCRTESANGGGGQSCSDKDRLKKRI